MNARRLEPDELEGYRELAKAYLEKNESAMNGYVAAGVLTEVMCNDKQD